MVCTIIDHRNDAIKCSKLKWNHEPQASGSTAKSGRFVTYSCVVYINVYLYAIRSAKAYTNLPWQINSDAVLLGTVQERYDN